MKMKPSILAIAVALGTAMAQTPQPNTPPAGGTPQDTQQQTPAKSSKSDSKSADNKSTMSDSKSTMADSKTATAEMKTMTYKGVLVDMSCAGSSASTSTSTSATADRSASPSTSTSSPSSDSSNCAVTANSQNLGMKLDNGQTVRFDLVGNQRAQDELKNNKRWNKDVTAGKPVHAKVSGVLNGDKLIVASIH